MKHRRRLPKLKRPPRCAHQCLNHQAECEKISFAPSFEFPQVEQDERKKDSPLRQPLPPANKLSRPSGGHAENKQGQHTVYYHQWTSSPATTPSHETHKSDKATHSLSDKRGKEQYKIVESTDGFEPSESLA